MGIIVTGGIAAPVLLMLGLERVSGIEGSLLLNLEGPLTLLIGIVVLREFLGRRAGIGHAVIFGAAAILGLEVSGGKVDGFGGLFVLAACLGWAIDNNLTQILSVRDPFQIVTVKTGIAAVVNITLALARGDELPSLEVLAGALAVGALAYGVSILLDAYTLRALGGPARPRCSQPHRSPVRCSRSAAGRDVDHGRPGCRRVDGARCGAPRR